jgi:uncharacterized protein YdeI (YjbR/CyaY-like superfamily)
MHNHEHDPLEGLISKKPIFQNSFWLDCRATCYHNAMPSDELPLLTFSSASAFARWLASQPDNSPGAWLKFSKKGAVEATISKSDAIDLALAHGWIDGQLGRIDELYFKTRFTPRKPKSAWSKINCERAERLIVSGQMTQQGLAQVDAAKVDGRWEAAYASQSTAAPHADLKAALDADPRARQVFDALDSANRYAIIYRVHQAKTAEKRAAEITELLTMLRRGQTIHPRRIVRGSRS